MPRTNELLELLGAVLAVVGLALWFLPAAFLAAGLVLVFVANAPAPGAASKRRPAPKPLREDWEIWR